MRSVSIVFCVFVVIFSVNLAQATIIHVPAQQPTIQAGINSSVNDDTILVAPGTYYEHINFYGKAILLTSEAGPESTIISRLDDDLALVTFNSGESNNSILDGFKIQNAYHYSGGGGGILCTNESSPTITHNVLCRNSAYDGGAIMCGNNSSPIISYNLLIENRASSAGGAIFCYYSSPLILNNTLDRNSNDNQGAIGCCGSSPEITNTIISNTLLQYGIFAYGNSSPTITCCDLWNNAAGDYEGCTPGVGCMSVDPLFCDTVNDDYRLHYGSRCLGTGQGGADVGAFGVGCTDVGDLNADGMIDVRDVVYFLNYMYNNGPEPNPLRRGDANCNGYVEFVDMIYLMNYLFKGGPPPLC